MIDESQEAPETEAPKKEKRPRDPDLWEGKPIEAWRKRTKQRMEFQPNPEFFAVADAVTAAGRTLLGYNRLYVMWQAMRNVAGVPGALAEVGSYRGGSAFFIAEALRSLDGEEPTMHVIDTFEGHPAQALTEFDAAHHAGQFDGTSYESVREYLAPFPQVTVHKGAAADVLPTLAETTYRFAHIDTDLYQPTLDCLGYFSRRLVRGGVMVLDDYSSKKCPGVDKAVTEFAATTSDFSYWDMRTGQLLVTKR